MIPVADPFMADAPVRRPGDFYRTVKGVPLVADPNGTLTKPKNKKDPGHVKRVMYRRPSGFGKQIENTYNLQKWGERQEALGFALDFNILKRATALLDGDRDSKEWKNEADSVVVAAKNAAKAWIAAERGTHTHGLAEDDDTDVDIITRIEHGETLGLDRPVQQTLVAEWRAMLERNGLEIVAVEFACVNDHYKAAGTGDRVARLTKSLRFRLCTGELVELAAGTYVILDIKTGQYRLASNGTPLYWNPYAIQVAIYAGGVLYDPDTDQRTPYPWPVDQDWAVIAHLDVLGALDGTPSCELVLVDLAAGRRAADLCVAARDWENEATVFSVAQLDVGVGDRGTAALTPTTDVEGGGGACPSAAVDPARHDHTSPSTLTVEGEVELGTTHPSASSLGPQPSPSTTVSPQATQSPAAVNAGPGGSAVPTRPPATIEQLAREQGVKPITNIDDLRANDITDEEADAFLAAIKDTRPTEALAWASEPAPAPLPALPDHPDEGDAWDDMALDGLKAKYRALNAVNRAWISRLVGEAQRANVGFHTQGKRTERRYLIIRALVDLAKAGSPDDDVLRALVTAALHNDAALDSRHTAGAVVGCLNATQAQWFADLVNDYCYFAV